MFLNQQNMLTQNNDVWLGFIRPTSLKLFEPLIVQRLKQLFI